MRSFRKGRAPRCLAKLKNTPGADWGSVSGTDKNTIRKALVAEQSGLCAYCMARIRVDGQMRVEHWDARATAPADMFAWPNLLGTCAGGGDGAPPASQSCDRAKGKMAIRIHPARGAHRPEAVFRYLVNGAIEADGPFDEDIRTLNLDCARLRRARVEVVELVIEQGKGRTLVELRALRDAWASPGSSGELRERCQVALYFLDKKIRQAEARAAAFSR